MNQAPAWPAPQPTAPRPVFGILRRLSRLILPLLGLLILASGAAAAPPRTPPRTPPGPQKADLYITIISFRGLSDQIGVSYNDDPGDAQIGKDLKEVARLLGSQVGPIDITRREGTPAGETNIPGLVNWTTGVVELDPLISVYRRYGHFHVVCMIGGPFPLKSAEQFSQGPVRIEPHVNNSGKGVTVDYEIWVDQKNGPPKSVPSVSGRRAGPDWVITSVIAGLVVLALLMVVMIVIAVRAQRRNTLATRPGETHDAINR